MVWPAVMAEIKSKNQRSMHYMSKNIPLQKKPPQYCKLAAAERMNCNRLWFKPRVSSYYTLHSLRWAEDCVFVCVLSRYSPVWMDSRESPPMLLTDVSLHKSGVWGNERRVKDGSETVVELKKRPDVMWDGSNHHHPTHPNTDRTHWDTHTNILIITAVSQL